MSDDRDGGKTGRVIEGDAFEVLEELPKNSVHAVVTDPPYGFEMEEWDEFRTLQEYQEWSRDWAESAMRVLRPGGHLVAFSGPQMFHRLFCGLEDAGYDVRDRIPFHHDVPLGEYNWLMGNGFPKGRHLGQALNGDVADEWEGWWTTLKPVHEPIAVVRSPLGEATITENVLEWGTGAFNIDECRLPIEGDGGNGNWKSETDDHRGVFNDSGFSGGKERETPDGRYPSNVALSEGVARELDERTGETTVDDGTVWGDNDAGATGHIYGDVDGDRVVHSFDDAGGPSRYYYVSKAGGAERTMDGQIENSHSAVKPLDLMKWLVKLVTAEDQVVLDPFCGSGTTLLAARELDREWLGIESDPEYADVARARAGVTPEDPSRVRPDNDQYGLEAFPTNGDDRGE